MAPLLALFVLYVLFLLTAVIYGTTSTLRSFATSLVWFVSFTFIVIFLSVPTTPAIFAVFQSSRHLTVWPVSTLKSLDTTLKCHPCALKFPASENEPDVKVASFVYPASVPVPVVPPVNVKPSIFAQISVIT